jgi:DNA (cytosine-5)-methyltransferase 1
MKQHYGNCLSFFSGCLGLDLGLEMAGLHSRLYCDFNKKCRESISANRIGIPVIDEIHNYSSNEVLELAGLERGKVFCISGGPPCQAFSTAGKRQGFSDPRGNVFLRFIDLILDIRPEYAIIENVRGLLSASLRHRPHNERGPDFPPLELDEIKGGALLHIISTLKEGGYSVSFNLYNSANYGAPQKRERVVIMISLNGRIPFLTPTHDEFGRFGLPKWISFKDSCSDIKGKQTFLEFPESRLQYYRLLKDGEYWKDLPTEEMRREALGKSYFSGGGKTGFLRRVNSSKPSPTLVTSPTMPATDLAHPFEDRPLSVEEYKRLQGFPDNWIIKGNIRDQYKQLGNAVPVQLGKAIGDAIINHHKGVATPLPEDFPYSRYKNTSDIDWIINKINDH